MLLVQMVMGEVPNKDVPDEGGIIVEGVMALELKRSRVQHTVFTVSRHSHDWQSSASAWPQQVPRGDPTVLVTATAALPSQLQR